MAETASNFCSRCHHGLLLRVCSEIVQGTNCWLRSSSPANTKRYTGFVDSESADVRKDRTYTVRRAGSSQDRTPSPRSACSKPPRSCCVRSCCPKSRESAGLCSQAWNRQGVWRSTGLPRCVLRNVPGRSHGKLISFAELLDDPNVDAVYNPVRKFVAFELRPRTHLL